MSENVAKQARELYAQLAEAVRQNDLPNVAKLSFLLLRLLVSENVADEIVEKLEVVVKELELGNLEHIESIGTFDDPRIERYSGPVRMMKAGPPGAGAPQAPELPEGSFRVWFGTNRKPVNASDSASGFAAGIDDQTHYGCADVVIPAGHKMGELGTWWLTKLWRIDFRDDKLKLQAISELAVDDFWREVQKENKEASKWSAGNDSVVFIHGFNTSFEAAAIRAAQIGYDLKVPGAMAMFSWPSRGSMVRYTEDGYSIKASEKAIKEFLIDFAQKSGARKVHVIAHSMGNRGFVQSLAGIGKDAARAGVQFGQFIFAAPDVEQKEFLENAPFFQGCERATLYASSRDWAVGISRWWNGNERAGYFAPYTLGTNFDTIAVPNFNIDLLGHTYFAQAMTLLQDIKGLMENNKDPKDRITLTEKTADTGRYFEMTK